MNERPILFSAPMVRAILDGTKTQTRRVMKSPWDIFNGEPIYRCGPDGGFFKSQAAPPHGQPGDRLWVRETWADLTATHGQRWERFNEETRLYERGTRPFAWYRADGDQPDIGSGALNPEPWRPSIHMPCWACRILLEVTGIRVERLQDISESDAKAEGCSPLVWDGKADPGDLIDLPLKSETRPYANDYALLWESINGAGSWEANPWVWVIEFKRIKQEQQAA